MANTVMSNPKGYRKVRCILFVTYALHLLLFALGRIFLRRVSMEINGAEKLRAIAGSMIFAPNHSSVLDPAVLCIALARSRLLTRCLPLLSVSREKKFYKSMAYPQPYFYGGFLFRLLGSLQVTPQSVRNEPERDTLAMHTCLLKKGFYTLIFPEGHITRDGNLLQPKLGVVKLSERTGVPIIPTCMNGVFRLDPLSLITGKAKISITFADPVYPSYPSGTSEHKISKEYFIKRAVEVMKRIAEQYTFDPATLDRPSRIY